MRIKTEAKIGLIMAATLALVYWGINYLKGRNVLKRTDVYHVVFEDVRGLDASSPVLLRGYKIGIITDIGFGKNKMDNIIVSFTIDHSINIPKESVIELISPDVLGSKALQILASDNPEFHKYGDTLLSAIKPDMLTSLGDEFTPIKEKLDTTILRINSMLESVNYVLDKETMDLFKNSMANLNATTGALKNQLDGGDLAKTIGALEELTQKLSENKDKLDNIFSNIENISDSLARANITGMLNSANRSFNEAAILLNSINNGEGSLGQLATNESLYQNLNASIESLNRLLIDLNENPKRYVKFSLFGGKNKEE